MRAFRSVFLAVLVLGSIPVSASNPQPYLDERGEWPRVFISEHVSQPGQSLEDFIMRDVGPALNEFTRQSGHEGCGVIGTDGQRFSVRLTTDGVQHGCAINRGDLVEGHRYAGETIHSHPSVTRLRLTRRDRAWSAHYSMGNPWTSEILNEGKSGFSDADYEGGPGWLVVQGRVLRQNGRGNLTRFGFIKDWVGERQLHNP